MRTQDFEQSILSRLGPQKNGWLSEIAEMTNVRRISAFGQPTQGRTKATRENAGTTTKNYSGREYEDIGRYEVLLEDSVVLMTVGLDKEGLTFDYFGITPDEGAVDCLNKQYECEIIMSCLRRLHR